MKKYMSGLLASLLSAMAIQASAQIAKIKDGDRLSYTSADYAAKRCGVALDAERTVAIVLTEKDGHYTSKGEQGSSTFVRKNHARISRETPQGVKTETPAEQQYNWDAARWRFQQALGNKFCYQQSQLR
jgi:uncharacterized protein (DUF2345 family)